MNNLLIDKTATEKDKIARINRRLLTETFIVKQRDDKSKEDYNFIKNNKELINDIFEPFGYVVAIDTSMEVAMLSIKQDMNIGYLNRLQFGKNQSLFIAILYQFFVKKKLNLNANVLINNEELEDELKVFGLNMSKKEILDVITILRKHNIVNKNTKEDIIDKDGELIIYPSIYFTIDINVAEKKYQLIKESMQLDTEFEETEEEILEEDEDYE